MTSTLKTLFINSHSYDAYLCRVSLDWIAVFYRIQIAVRSVKRHRIT